MSSPTKSGKVQLSTASSRDATMSSSSNKNNKTKSSPRKKGAQQHPSLGLSSSYSSDQSSASRSQTSPSKEKNWKKDTSTKMGEKKDQRHHGNPITNLFKKLSPKHGGSNTNGDKEQSPLLSSVPEGQATSYDAGSSSRSSKDPEIGLTPFHPVPNGKKDYWKILKDHISNGDFLLKGVNCDNVEVRRRQTGNSAEKHEYKFQEKIDEIRRGMEFNWWHGVLAIIVYLGISVACFSTLLEPEWSMLDSIYFAMVTVTTVGYGDEVPTTDASMIFTCVYALSGVAILGLALGVLGSDLVDAQEAVADKAGDLLTYQVMSVFDSSSELKPQDQSETKRKIDEDDDVRRPSLLRSALACLKGFLPLMIFMLVMAYWIGNRAGWSLMEVVYFMVVTATTVGYGDFTPKSDEEKMLAVLFIPIAVGAMGVWLGGVANIIVESRSSRYRKDMGMKELTMQDLEIMDSDGDGIVTRAEFLEFMLVAMNKMDKDLMEELRTHFRRLDVDGTGELTKEDLVEQARKKLKSPPHKLRLAMYKDRLMETSRQLPARSSIANEWSSRFLSSFRIDKK